MERKELFKHLPWHVIAQWWMITALLIIYMLPLIIIGTINPLWFREDLMNWMTKHVESLSLFRDRLLRPQLDKYLLFEMIKKTGN